MLYHLLTGHAPHEGESREDVLSKAEKGHVVSPRQWNPTISRPLERACLKALASEPSARYGSPAEFGEALRHLGRRKRQAALVGVIVIILALAAGAYWWLRPPPLPPGPLSGRLAVHQYRSYEDPKRLLGIGRLGEGSDSCRVNDLLKVGFDLDRPAYAYLIALNAKGGAELLVPTSADEVPRRTYRHVFPQGPRDFYILNDGAGYHAFVLVASREPLPSFSRWALGLKDLPWTTIQKDGVWIFDDLGLRPELAASGLERGQVITDDTAPQPILEVCQKLQSIPGIDTVRALGFPVRTPGDR
ncbi:hypothetical protein OJF2_10020 [Aquisphaera giovannonii]|uniref:DUF4384 domain-containing protein n=1 Tax=Aquisphaera giovannonii TaxID=406548 RepID=A0A5B9VXM2_9BACT|nr:hypothetical protein [Aquisphaera giovannonii]QEH32525.1 hypothetical protein OJF2_10020 [Aquisphaera giovannonii]